MQKSILYQGKKINFTIEGQGTALLFLHGYLESLKIWSGFTSRFTNKHTVISIDIPGHGESEVIGRVHDMEEMARIAAMVLDAEGVEKVVVFGHSMGGYITMEFVHIFSERVRGYCLFHSTCFADDEDKKLNRDREISLVMCGKKMQIIHTNIPKAFANDNIDLMKSDISEAKSIASQSNDEGIIALLHGMKQRKDHSEILKKTSPPVLIIWGEKDNYIGEAVFKKLIELAPHASVVTLKKSGHMGFIEEADCVAAGIFSFLDSLK